jgi:hypothetical protein
MKGRTRRWVVAGTWVGLATLVALWPLSHRYTSFGIDLESPDGGDRVRCTFYRIKWPGDGSVCVGRLVEHRAANAKSLERFDLGGRFFKPGKETWPASVWNRWGFWWVTRPGGPQGAAPGMAPGASEVFLVGVPHWLLVVAGGWVALVLGAEACGKGHRPSIAAAGRYTGRPMSGSEITYRADRTPLVPPGGAEVHARDMTATFSADVTLAEAQGRLAELGQWLPIDGDASWTLGRLVGLNSTGPLRLGYGAWRDLLLGCQFLNGRGELISAGGRTVKNVAGYDLTKFMVGQAGVFGRLVTVTTRTYRRPAGAILARFAPDPWVVNRLLPTPCRPQWIALTPQATWCGYLGDERTLAYYRGALAEHGPVEVTERSVDEDVAHRADLWRVVGTEGAFRASVPPTRVLEFAAATGLNDWTADAAFGIVIGLAGAQRAAIESAARGLGGSVYFIENGRPAGRWDEGVRTLLGRLKAAFDPEGKLEPLPAAEPS